MGHHCNSADQEHQHIYFQPIPQVFGGQHSAARICPPVVSRLTDLSAMG
jgi:hypothetical protein